MHIRTPSAPLFAAVAVLAAAAAEATVPGFQADSSRVAIVHGTVTDPRGDPIAGARVDLILRYAAADGALPRCVDGGTVSRVYVHGHSDSLGRYRVPVPVPAAMGDDACLEPVVVIPAERVPEGASYHVEPARGVVLRFAGGDTVRLRLDFRAVDPAARRADAAAPDRGARRAPEALRRSDPRGAARGRHAERAELAQGEVPGFAGLYMEGCDGVIALTDTANAATARNYFRPLFGRRLNPRPACPEPELRIEQVRYDFAQLWEWRQQAARAAHAVGVVTTVGIDEMANRVTIGAANEESARRMEAAISRLGLPPDAVGVRIEPMPRTRRQREREAPSAEESIRVWERENPGEPLPASIGFDALVPDATVLELLERYDVAPYVVYLRAAGASGPYRVDRAEAALGVIRDAREHALRFVRDGLCTKPERFRMLLDEPPRGWPDSIRASHDRSVLTRFELEREALPRIREGAPVIYGVEIVGPPEAVARLGQDPLVRFFAPGMRMHIRGAERVIVGQPMGPEEFNRPPEPLPHLAALSDQQLRARLAEIAELELEECAGWHPQRH